jgi:sRNA-binding protein
VTNSLLSLSGKRNENNTMIDAQSTTKLLCEKFPAFAMYEQRRRPLALGIHKEIAAAMPTLTKEQISTATRSYVANEFYCRACREGAARINLMGHEVGGGDGCRGGSRSGAHCRDKGMAEKEEGCSKSSSKGSSARRSARGGDRCRDYGCTCSETRTIRGRNSLWDQRGSF